MLITLTRYDFSEHGIFGVINLLKIARLQTLERAINVDGLWRPKVPAGKYRCVRGMHRLAKMNGDFETFEIKDVPGHWGILFHVGNYNSDSQGCVLLGEFRQGHMVTESRKAFTKFMSLMDGVDEFQLTIEDK